MSWALQRDPETNLVAQRQSRHPPSIGNDPTSSSRAHSIQPFALISGEDRAVKRPNQRGAAPSTSLGTLAVKAAEALKQQRFKEAVD